MTHPQPGSQVYGIGNRPTEVIDTFVVVNRDQDSDTRPAVYASGDLYTFYTTTRESNGAFNFFDFFLPVNGGPPPHYHPYEHEIWYITDGDIRFDLGNTGEKSIVLPPGTTIFGPINLVHGYGNIDSTELFVDIATPGARTLSMTTPGALDLFFDAAAQTVIDRSDPPPPFTGPTPDDFLNLAKFNERTGAGIVLSLLDPTYVPPADSLPYVLVLGADATGDVLVEAKGLMSDPNFKVWTTGTQEGIPQRPTVVGDFGLTYTSLVNFEETADKFEYNQFSLNPNANNLGTETSGEDNIIFYVKGDNDVNTNKRLTVTIFSHDHDELSVAHDGEHSHDDDHSHDDESTIIIAEENTYVYVAPGNSYTISNQGIDSVEALSVTIPKNPAAAPQPSLFTSPLLPESTITPSKTIQLGNGDDFFSQSDDAPNSYRSLFDVAPGYSDYFIEPVTINGVAYDGVFESAAINPSTGRLVVDTGVFSFVNGSFQSLVSHNFEEGINLEILRDDYRQIAVDLGKSERVGVITQLFFDANQATTTIPAVLTTLPSDIYDGISDLSKTNPLPPNGFTPLPFEDPNRYSNPYDFLVIPAFEFAFDVFRDKPQAEGGLPIPIVGGDRDTDSDNVGWTFESFESRRLINAGGGNDTIVVMKDDIVYGESGNDTLDASQGKGRNKLYGGVGNDSILVNYNDRAFGEDGDDRLDASQGIGLEGLSDRGRNLLDGGAGNDVLVAGSNGELYGGGGNDALYISEGGNNLLYGGGDQDKFWLINQVVPETVLVEYSDFAQSLLPPGLTFPELRDTQNTIMDFQLGTDKIYINAFGTSILAYSFDDLQLLPVYGDLYSTSIIAKFTELGVTKELSIGNVQGIIFNEFSANDFAFGPEPRLIVGTPGNDTAIANDPNSNVQINGIRNTIFTGAGNDEIDLVPGVVNALSANDNRVNAGSGDDILYVNKGDRVFGGAGDDTFDATDGNGGNRMSGGDGNDTFFLGAGDRALGGNGNDRFFVQSGGNNLLSGGAGADQFWMLTDAIPSVANTIADFVSGVDVIGIANQGTGVDFNDLSLVGNTIAFKGQENQPFATLTGIQTNTLTAANFVFA